MRDSGRFESLRVYARILAYMVPYIGQLVLVLVFNLFFVVFNALSIWMIAPFITTLFGTVSGTPQAEPTTVDPSAGLLGLNTYLKQFYVRWVVRPDPLEGLQVICLVIFGTFLLKNIFQFCEAYLVSYVEQKVIKDLRDEIFAKTLRKPLRFFDRYNTGNLISRVTNDINALNVAVNESFTKIIRDPLLIVIFLSILLSINWRLSLLASVVIPTSGLVIRRIGQSLKRRSSREQERIADVTTRLQDTLSGIRVIKAFAQEEPESERFRDRTEQHFRAVLRKVRMHRLSSPLTETLGVGIMVAVLWHGGRLVLESGALSAEDFIRFLAVLFAVLDPMKSLANLNNNIQIAVASGIRVFEVIDHPDVIREVPNARGKTSLTEGIEYEGVDFRYEARGSWVVRDISFRIRKGEKVALVGSSGAGKTTIANLLPRFYDVNAGHIRIDGIDIRELRLADLRRMNGIVSQDVVLFNDPVAYNIAYGQADVTPEQLEEAAGMANALDFIRQFENGFDTVVGERGTRLSGGERQRISIARAVMLNPPILVFDEATSSLDSESERLIQDAIEKLLRDRTVLMIAHRLSTILHCDQILVLENGRVVARGAHEKLLASSPRYAHLYELQFGAAVQAPAVTAD